MDIVVLIIVVAVVIVLVAGALYVVTRRRSAQLQEHFGPEYDRSVAETGNRRATEAELRQRQKRRRELDIRELSAQDRARFEAHWDHVQRGFVDDPDRALHDADRLVVDIMRSRGYPTDDFDRRAEDISVDHPDLVLHYRAAHAVRDACSQGNIDTERQRLAVTSYRSLVMCLLDGSSHRPDHEQAPDHPQAGHPQINEQRQATDQRPADGQLLANDHGPTEERIR